MAGPYRAILQVIVKNRLLGLALLSCLLITAGCGKQMTGVFESELPTMPTADFGIKSPQMDTAVAKLNDAMSQVRQNAMMRISFEGSKVRVSSGYGITTEYTYTAYDDRIEIPIDSMGQHMTLTMPINADGSLLYMGLRFVRVQ